MPALLDLLREPFQRHARALRQLRLPLLHLRYARCPWPCRGPPFTGKCRLHPAFLPAPGSPPESTSGLGDWQAAVVEHRPDLAERVAHNAAVARAQRSVSAPGSTPPYRALDPVSLQLPCRLRTVGVAFRLARSATQAKSSLPADRGWSASSPTHRTKYW